LPIWYSKAGVLTLIVTLFLIAGYACQPADGGTQSLTTARKAIKHYRAKTLSCQEDRYVKRFSIDHAEKSTSIVYLRWTAKKWRSRSQACSRNLRADRKWRKHHPVAHAKKVARYLLRLRGWADQFWALDAIIQPESAWRVCVRYGGKVDCTYRGQLAYGLPQALPGIKMASAGPDWQTNPETQLRWLLFSYMGPGHRYADPCDALRYRRAHGSY